MNNIFAASELMSGKRSPIINNGMSIGAFGIWVVSGDSFDTAPKRPTPINVFTNMLSCGKSGYLTTISFQAPIKFSAMKYFTSTLASLKANMICCAYTLHSTQLDAYAMLTEDILPFKPAIASNCSCVSTRDWRFARSFSRSKAIAAVCLFTIATNLALAALVFGCVTHSPARPTIKTSTDTRVTSLSIPARAGQSVNSFRDSPATPTNTAPNATYPKNSQ